MLKLFIKLAIAALLANAVYRVGSAYLTHIKFRDAIREAAMFKARDDNELWQHIHGSGGRVRHPADGRTAVTIQREDRRCPCPAIRISGSSVGG